MTQILGKLNISQSRIHTKHSYRVPHDTQTHGNGKHRRLFCTMIFPSHNTVYLYHLYVYIYMY